MTIDAVRAAVEGIEAAGGAAGVVAIMERCGGSYPVVKGLLDQVRAERAESRTGLIGDIVPDEGPYPAALTELFEGMAAAWRGMVAGERDRADRTILAAQQAADRRVVDAERRSEGLERELERTEALLAEMSEDLEREQGRSRRLEGRVQRLERELAQAVGRLEGRGDQGSPPPPHVEPEPAEPEPAKGATRARRASPRPFSDAELAQVARELDAGRSLRDAARAIGRDPSAAGTLSKIMKQRRVSTEPDDVSAGEASFPSTA